MSSANSRITDLWAGICFCHIIPVPMVGPIITASLDHKLEDLGQARFSDLAIGFCGHPTVIVTASSESKTNNRGKARIGDAVVGCGVGVIITGAGSSKVE